MSDHEMTKPRRTKLTPLGWVLVPAFLAVLAGMGLWLVLNVIWPLIQIARRTVPLWSEPSLYVAGGLTIAAALAVVRGGSLRAYGVIEIVFACGALAVTSVLVASKANSSSIAISYIGSVYVVIRGFHNVWQTLTKETRYRIRSFIYEGASPES